MMGMRTGLRWRTGVAGDGGLGLLWMEDWGGSAWRAGCGVLGWLGTEDWGLCMDGALGCGTGRTVERQKGGGGGGTGRSEEGRERERERVANSDAHK